MSDISLAGLFSPYSGSRSGAAFKNTHHSHTGARHRGDAENKVFKHPVERPSFDINLQHVGRHHLRPEFAGKAGEGEERPDRERDFEGFRNYGQRRSSLAFFENFMRKLMKVFAIKILGDFLTALKDGASLDQLSLDESKDDIAEATENGDSVVSVDKPGENEGADAPASLVSLSISVGFQIDITIGRQSSDGDILSSQTLEAKNPVVVDQSVSTDLVA